MSKELIMMDPRNKELSLDEETVEILEVIEQCDDYSDLDDGEYEVEYLEEEF